MATEKERLLAEAKELGVPNVSKRMGEDTLRERIADFKADQVQASANQPEPAQSLPVEVTTEPTKVEANNARFDEDHSDAVGFQQDEEVLNPGPQEASGGSQDPEYVEAVRAADKSGPFASVMVTNAAAGIFNEPPPYEEPKRKKPEDEHLADEGTGAGGPDEKMA